ncbi:MAG: response regulator [Acidobacteria bacterium]|nr:MAG: response regulator [Acidobacteriota bacterium]
MELELVCRDGHRIPVRLNMVGVRDRQGAYQGYWATARDISAEKRLEAQLLQAQKLESLGTLVGGIAHDFNNMLTAILGYAQLLLGQANQEDRFYEHLQQIEVLSQRAADVVQQLLTFSREGTSRQRRLLLHPLLKEIGKLLQRMIPENIEVEMHLAAEDLAIEADPTQLQQVVMNLVVNARDAMPEGGQLRIETARVKLDESFCRAHPNLRPGDYVRLRVSDTGVGIPPDIQRRIFDPFFTTKEAGKGTGLGLPVVYGIVKNHGGAVEVESEVGRGTTIALYFPLVEKPAEVERASSAEVKGGSETILLVEDEPTVLELARAALEHYGYQVLTAQNGVEAIATYRDHGSEIALVILDVVMPKLGGRETFRELQRIDPGVKAILASGYDTSESLVNELLQSGVCGLVRKPYQIQELAQAVRQVLDQSMVEDRKEALTKNKTPHPPHPFFGLI